ncbi:hypothetical protein MIR68_002955 [Amoeboaphelidium protococcarum]|nr:hypothetical protein MIR68_002955 [Amoeboaphelidium protococcarum]
MHQPLIKFLGKRVWNNIKKETSTEHPLMMKAGYGATGSGVTSASKATQNQQGQQRSSSFVQFYESTSDLPRQYWYQSIQEQEIEVINAGGALS